MSLAVHFQTVKRNPYTISEPCCILPSQFGAICNDKHTPEFNTGFSIGCDEKQRHLIPKDENDMYMVPPGHDKDWNLGSYDSTMDTSSCPEPNPK